MCLLVIDGIDYLLAIVMGAKPQSWDVELFVA
jgi:hypothetical protein